MRRWILLLLLAALMLPVAALTESLSGRALARQDAPGCEGLAEYREAMFAVGRYLNDAVTESGLAGDRDLLTYSSDDWQTYVDITLEVQRQLKDITPPAFAAEYHQVQIETFGLFEQIGRTAVKNGAVGLLEPFGDTLDELGQRQLGATLDATATCADFEALASDWDQQSATASGSPVASSTAAQQEVAEVEPKPSPTPAVQTIAMRFETSGTGVTWTDIFMIPGTYFMRFECDTQGGTAGIYVPWLGPETIDIAPTGTLIEFPDTGNNRGSQALLGVKCDGSWTLVGTPGN